FRWVTNDAGYARSCLRADPMTGEMLDGDVIFDAGFIRAWKQEYALLIASKTTAEGAEPPAPLALGEIVSPIPASRIGFAPPAAPELLGLNARHRDPSRLVPEVIPSDQNFLAWALARTSARNNRGFCEFQSGIQRDLALAAIAMADTPPQPPKGGDK